MNTWSRQFFAPATALLEDYQIKFGHKEMSLNPFNHPIVFSIPRWLTPFSFWHEHIPFAMFLVDLLKPEVIVELGTQYGDSYCAFCYSVHELNLATRCYAIDNWQGDPHVGSYGPEVLADLRAHHDPLYGSFSRLIQSTFDDARQHFSDGFIDLLHIDGYHTYEVVRHDFESWLPKMSDEGVVLFHDTNVRERDFGVWKLWEELERLYPHFEFLHGSGLGVLAVGKGFPAPFRELLDASAQDTANLRKFFSELGKRLTLEVQQRRDQKLLTERDQQVTQICSDRERFAQEIIQLRNAVEEQQRALAESDRERFHEISQLRDALEKQQRALAEKEQELAQVAAERVRLGGEIAKFQQELTSQQQEIGRKEQEISRLSVEKGVLGYELTSLRTLLEQELQQAGEQREALLRIYESHGWKALALYYRVRNRLLPEESYRRAFAKKMFHAIFGSPEIKNLQQPEMSLQSRTEFLNRDNQLTVRAQISKVVEIADLALPLAPSAPLVSIIIPVYNQFNFTLRCLKSIQDNPSKASAEILIIDDGSQDQTPKALADISGIRYIRNEENLGFLRSCNRAALDARGEYLVFLNNDTEVQKDWLDNMLAVFEQLENVGLVGAKLVYPDGRLQEAGGIVWSDGSAMNFGREDDPGKPEYNYVREADYCSAACIVTRASLFRELNGFDELFTPAYYEDTDLAFKIRESGHRVFFQPAAEIIHFEGATCGTDLSSGVKSYQRINAQKFAEKWSEALKRQHPPETVNKALARDRGVVGRCLIIDVWPMPDRDSGSIDCVHLMKCFQSFAYKVTFYPENTIRFLGKYTQQLQQMGVECLYEPFVATLSEYLKGHGEQFDIVVLRRGPCAVRYFDTVRLYCPKAKIIFDTVDLNFLREERAARIKKSSMELKNAELLKENELKIVKRADCTLVVSTVEQALLEQEAPDAVVEWFPFVRDIPGRTKTFEERRHIAFIGGYLHEPNIDAVHYFVKDIWSSVAERLPDVQFLIVGSYMPEAFHRLESNNVRTIGYVEDLTTFLENCRLTVAPLRYGAGIKGKVATSLSHGVPVVASPVAAEGMGGENGTHFIVAETVAEWVESVVRAYTNKELWEHLSHNGIALMREIYSMRSGLARMRSLLARLNCAVPNDYSLTPEASSSRSAESSGEPVIVVRDLAPREDGPARDSESDVIAARAIAFYLPQYHPIPENDRWWGKGFTEWTYVVRAKPLFPGHYQPQLPTELGFYDLRLAEAREAQAVLAREHGVYGFCYHYYWFGGKRLLDRPLTEVLASRRPSFPFCICWANENWTRRWDGRDQEILMKQEYSRQGDLAFIQDLLPALSDHRYIRVNGRPLLLVYRTESLPNPKATAEIWREESIRAGIGDLYLCRVESFSAIDPENIGFDASCQFPPLLIGSPELDPVSVFNGADPSEFKGKMLDYRGLAQRALNSEVYYKRFFGVTPSWDNTARRGNNAYMWLNGSPEEYEKWFAQALANTMSRYQGEERLIFINAWNEWGEGCHLEPDQRHGRTFLQATRRALVGLNRTVPREDFTTICNTTVTA